MEWSEIKQESVALAEQKNLSAEYKDRLQKELYEIEKQGANSIWTDWINQRKTWVDNKNGLILPWLFNLTPVDPINISYIYEEHGDGDDSEIATIIIGDKSIDLPIKSLIKTKRGIIRVADLQVGDEVI